MLFLVIRHVHEKSKLLITQHMRMSQQVVGDVIVVNKSVSFCFVLHIFWDLSAVAIFSLIFLIMDSWSARSDAS